MGPSRPYHRPRQYIVRGVDEATQQRDAADEGRLEASGSIIVGENIVNEGRVVRPSQLIASVRRTRRITSIGRINSGVRTMKPNLDAVLEQVIDETSFLEFVRALEADWQRDERESAGKPWGYPGGWENGTIGAFLERAVAWAEDSKAAWAEDSKPAPRTPPPATNPWRRCADILRAGAFYE
jgi:hypothetical protein